MNSKRVFRIKNPVKTFYCPLCGVKRGLKYRSKLSLTNYIQIVVGSTALSAALFPFIGLESIFLVFFAWGGFELVNKVNFRKEVACSTCGFDATWYKRDIKMARKLVAQFQQNLVDQKSAEASALENSDLPQESLETAADSENTNIPDGLLSTLNRNDGPHTEAVV